VRRSSAGGGGGALGRRRQEPALLGAHEQVGIAAADHLQVLLQERKVLTVQQLDGRVGGGVKPDRLGNGRPGRDGGEAAASAHGEEQADKLYLPAIPERRRRDREPGGNRGVPRQLGEESREDAVEQSGRSLFRDLGLWDLKPGEKAASMELANDAEHSDQRVGWNRDRHRLRCRRWRGGGALGGLVAGAWARGV